MTTGSSALLNKVITQTHVIDASTHKSFTSFEIDFIFFYHKYEFSHVFHQNQVRQVVIAQLFLHEVLRGV